MDHTTIEGFSSAITWEVRITGKTVCRTEMEYITVETYVQRLRDFDPSVLQTRHSRLVFWINAYNILTIYAVQKNLEGDPDFNRGAIEVSRRGLNSSGRQNT